jgi:outer membrane protein, heavy metal efflux system
MKNILVSIVPLLITVTASAQGAVDSVLSAVGQNNKSIQANTKFWEAKKTEYKTGLTPYDPQVEYDYMMGSPAEAGNQRDFSVTQRLDFPTTYQRKRALSKDQVTQAGWQQSAFRQDVLLDAKMVVLELIYRNKQAAELGRRLQQIQQLTADYQKKLEKGDVIILDVNKAKVQLLNIQNDVALNASALQVARTRLTQLNGGVEILVKDTVYPAVPLIPDFETLDSVIEANDPIIKVYEQEKRIQQGQVNVQKALNLPKIETGYHSQGILGQSYKGIHAGISIPLWENKNRLKAAKLNLDYATANAETQKLEHRLENKQLYEQLEVRRNAMQDYYAVMSSLNNTALLDKALRLGQITIIQYFQDQNYYYAAYDKHLQLEWEYHKAVAQLFKYLL